jgi:hypothetical protein
MPLASFCLFKTGSSVFAQLILLPLLPERLGLQALFHHPWLVFEITLPRLALNLHPPISASRIAGIIGVHHCPYLKETIYVTCSVALGTGKALSKFCELYHLLLTHFHITVLSIQCVHVEGHSLEKIQLQSQSTSLTS